MKFPLPSPLFYLLPLAGYWLVLIYYLGAQWSAYEQYSYGWAVPFLCLYLAWRKTESAGGKAEKLKSETLKSGNTEIQGAFSFSAFQLFSVCLLCLLYAPTRFLHEANPTWRLTSLLWTLEVIGLTLLSVHLALGATPALRDLATRPSRNQFQLSAFSFSDFVFPICFFLVAVPWPSGMENLVTQSLMRLDTATTVELLGFLGIPAVQQGNAIEVGTGVVGIDEACSGIRSLQAALMLSLFFGEVYALCARRRALCVVAGFALAFMFNVGRTLLLTRIAAAKGLAAVASWHDPVGVAMLVACFLCLWLIARGFRGDAETLTRLRRTTSRRTAESGGGKAEMLTPELNSNRAPFSVSAFQRFSIFLLAWLLVVEGGTACWYRAHEHSTGGATDWSVNLEIPQAAVARTDLPARIRDQFQADDNLQLRWRDSSGNDWLLYYFRWLTPHTLKERVAVQLAKVHGPEICLPAAGMTMESSVGVVTVPLGDTVLALQQYRFRAEGRLIHIFYGIYEDANGCTVLTDRRQSAGSRMKAALAGNRSSGQRFLELALVGPERPEDARAALTRELGKLIKVEKTTDQFKR